jgi:ABC-2 type transport system ATP-binding protein
LDSSGSGLPRQDAERLGDATPAEQGPGRGQEDHRSDVQLNAAHAQSVEVNEDRGPRPALEAIDVRKRFVVRGWVPGRPKAAVEALRGATLSVDHGSIHGVIGPNGSGKSTLLRVLATLVIADGGRARVNGYDVHDDERMVRGQIGFTTGEERSLYWRLTARQNLEFAATLYRLRRPAEAVGHALEVVGLDADADRPVSGYSQGMSRRLGLARAILHQPPILLLDEPTRSLDPTARAEFQHVLMNLRRERGVTTLLTTHDLGEAATLCDAVSVLLHGRFVDHLGASDENRLAAVLRRLPE